VEAHVTTKGITHARGIGFYVDMRFDNLSKIQGKRRVINISLAKSKEKEVT
jgi:hypothetical protein